VGLLRAKREAREREAVKLRKLLHHLAYGTLRAAEAGLQVLRETVREATSEAQAPAVESRAEERLRRN